MKEVGNGYMLITSQNGKFPWSGGTGFLLSPSAAEAFKATGCRTWTPPTNSVTSGRYLEIRLAAATKKEGIITFASVYAPTAQTTLDVRQAFWSLIEERMMKGDFNTTEAVGAQGNETKDDAPDENTVTKESGNESGAEVETDVTVKKAKYHDRRRPARRIYMAMGDWNARVGNREAEGDPYRGVLGPHNFSNRNANGTMMLETMVRCGMRIANTYFQHDDNHTATWMNPATKEKRVIDHVVTRAWQMRHVVDVRSRPGWNVDSDHEVCSVTLRGNPRGRRANISRWKIPGLEQRKGRLAVDVLTDEAFKLDNPGGLETMTSKIARSMEDKMSQIHTMEEFDEALREVAKGTLPEKQNRDTWAERHRTKIEAALSRRLTAKEGVVKKSDERAKKELRDAEKSLRRITKRALYEHLTDMCNKMQAIADEGKGLPRDFFRELSNVKRFLGCYENPKSELLTDVKARVKEMDNFFQETRFCQGRPMVSEEEILSVPPIEGIDVDAIFTEPDQEEVLRAVMALKNGKTTDIKGVQAEVLKAATRNPKVGEWFAKAVIEIWRGAQIPKHWLDALGFLIWKHKHPKSNLKNWRVVNLIATSSKVVSKMLHWRLQRLASCVWSQTQYGFRPGAWTMDAIFVVTRIMEDFRKTRRVEGESEEDVYRKTLYWMFEDYSTAFDGVPRDLLWKILRKIFKIPDHTVDLLRRFHDGFRMHSVVNNQYGKGFVTTSGVRQGCVTGPDLWNFHMQAVLWALAARMIRRGETHGVKVRYSTDGKIRHRCETGGEVSLTGNVTDSTYADDAAVPAVGLDRTTVFQQFWEACI